MDLPKTILLPAIGTLFLSSAALQAQDAVLELDLARKTAEIQPTMYGIFFEDINFAADGGLYAEMVKNRSFEFTLPKTGWSEPNSTPYGFNPESGSSSVMQFNRDGGNRRYLHITVNKASGYELINEGFRGMGVRDGEAYNLSVLAAKREGNIRSIRFALIDSTGAELGAAAIRPDSGTWKEYTASINSGKTEAHARLKITFEGSGSLDLDMVSLFPQDTWKGRPKGLRKDLVQLLYDMDPGFLRFPGGCIVEGRTLARRYQWKKTVGPVADREALINRWNTEFGHRPTPDYYQSFGLGFFEYFQLAEDLGAEPLPILGCGMACQFNTGELVPLDDLDPYIQDALDLIEFANGATDTPWGKVRSDMGHPEPFDMKYIGIGNEQWGPEYIERYKLFHTAIKAQYPEMVIVSGSGPFPEGDFFDYGWDELRELNAELIDEHYYRPPEWFRENATRYDGYDRNGPKVFAGEYAAQSVNTASPDNKNDWNCALSEAAFMTGLERNADVVVMTSYAPLMAHAEGWQWTPDLIWFNNLESYGTANYYVQQLFANHRGTHVLPLTRDGSPLTGQDGLYATAALDEVNGTAILKIVNTTAEAREIEIIPSGGNIGRNAVKWVLRADDPGAVNSFDRPRNIAPVEEDIKVNTQKMNLGLAPRSLTVVRLDLR